MGDALWPYERVLVDLRRKIESGELQPGSQLPTRLKLAAEYRVTHMTVQRAIDTLKEEGLLYSRPGLGVYVKKSPEN